LDQICWLFQNNRKSAAEVNRQFLGWLSRRSQPERPFFAFLNYYDAHYPYELPALGIHRFGEKPRTIREANEIRDWPQLIQKGPTPYQINYGRDAYDDCIADLDEHLGRLIDELGRRSILDRTWVIVTADHGESFGENPGVFWHGTSLYQAQLHVPLVIVPPSGISSSRVVTEPVSLRDLAATIVDLLACKPGSPFPGNSLAHFWNASAPEKDRDSASDPVLAEVVPLDSFGPDPSRSLNKSRWPMAALIEGDWTYIRREGDVREELYQSRQNAPEQQNVASDPAMRPTLQRLRDALNRMTSGPLTPQRFNP
jgi:arylsulfatase A-like enzyme